MSLVGQLRVSGVEFGDALGNKVPVGSSLMIIEEMPKSTGVRLLGPSGVVYLYLDELESWTKTNPIKR